MVRYLREELRRLEERVRAFEAKYGMSVEELYEKLPEFDMDPEVKADYAEWD